MTVRTPVLDAAISSWLDRCAELVRAGGQQRDHGPIDRSVDERRRARELSDALFEEFGVNAPTGVERRTFHIDTVDGPLRIDEYRPLDSSDEILPAHLLLHGGAFRLGAIDEKINVAFCSQRALGSGYAVYSLEYRLAPENPFPAALDDARWALEWMTEKAAELKLDAARIVVGGVSAGGCIAASLVIDRRDRGRSDVAALLLEVPVVDVTDEGPWRQEYAELNGFSTLADLRGEYSGGRSPEEPQISPLLADLRNLPPVHVMTAEFDPLRQGGEEFVAKLREAGNRVSATRHLGQLHGSHGLLRDLRAARLWHAEVAAVLQEFAL